MQVFYDELTTRVRGLLYEWKGRVFRAGTLAIFGASVFLASVLGPFGTYVAMSWPERSVYWAGVLVVAIPLALLVCTALRQRIGSSGGWRSGLLAVMVFAVIFSPFLWGYTRLFVSAEALSSYSFWYFLRHAAAVAFGAFFLRMAVRAVTITSPEEGAAEPEPMLLSRLPEAQRAPVLRLTVEDHFVDVVSANGKARLRMRFRDAVREMAPAEGFVVHRSHWVARSAIVGRRVEAGRMFLQLVDGEEVPVSRKYRETVELALAS